MTAGWSVLFTAPCYYQPPAPSLHSCHPATSVAQGQGSHPAEKSQLWGCFYSPGVLLFPHGHRRAAADKGTAALSPGATQPPPGAAMGAEKPQGRMLSQMKQQGRSLLAGWWWEFAGSLLFANHVNSRELRASYLVSCTNQSLYPKR